MIEVWSWPTANGHKVHITLEELGPPYTVIPINIGKGDQFQPEFLALTPNHRRNIDLSVYPHVQRWHDAIAARPAVQRGVAVLADNQRRGSMTDAEREVMFGKTQFAIR
jgi:glutathione S-transferase